MIPIMFERLWMNIMLNITRKANAPTVIRPLKKVKSEEDFIKHHLPWYL